MDVYNFTLRHLVYSNFVTHVASCRLWCFVVGEFNKQAV
jgi:hypothetical protein